jgi:hypothetical protein
MTAHLWYTVLSLWVLPKYTCGRERILEIPTEEEIADDVSGGDSDIDTIPKSSLLESTPEAANKPFHNRQLTKVIQGFIKAMSIT